MSSGRTRGIILHVSDHGEADKIITLYSPDLGRVTGIAKGAKRSKKRFVNKLEEFSLLQIIYRPARGDGLFILSEADLENAYLSIRTHYDRYVVAMYAGELALRFTREHDPDPEIFSLLAWTMQELTEERDPLAVAAFFHLRLLGAAGYEPQLARCGLCNAPVENGRDFALHVGRGTLVCARCLNEQREAVLPFSMQTLKFLQHAQHADLKNLTRLRLSRNNALEALRILHRYTQHLLQHDIHAWSQVRKLAGAQTPDSPSA
ncbi:MAG TPA: DNA repair protein RecO [Desulfobulbaceae bacterium]|nr:DNA repair protein RecO [Desulfobulbaceae bacterium]